MRVDVLAAAQLDMHRLRILAAEVRGAAMIVRPFIADHDRRVAIFHLAVREITVGVEQHEGGLEHERLLQPAERRLSGRSEEHTSDLQSLMSISYAVFCLKKKININRTVTSTTHRRSAN